jgi:hypothetical protein
MSNQGFNIKEYMDNENFDFSSAGHKTYNTFLSNDNDNSNLGKNLSSVQICGLMFMLIMSIITLSINGVGLYIGNTHNNATCYENKKEISLSYWLVLTTTVSIITGSIIIFTITIQLICYMIDVNAVNTIWLPAIIVMLISSLFSFVMLIYGIIELSYQYPSCHTEVYNVTTMIIVIVVMNCIHFLSICCCKHK